MFWKKVLLLIARRWWATTSRLSSFPRKPESAAPQFYIRPWMPAFAGMPEEKERGEPRLP
jgi:hypothetical protein